MENKNEIITTTMNAPEGYEMDWENSIIEKGKEVKIVWKLIKKKEVTYDDVCRKLFKRDVMYYTGDNGWVKKCNISGSSTDGFSTDLNNATSEQQLRKMLAFNKLMNIAEYLNDGWKPNWGNREENKFFIDHYDDNDKRNEYNVGKNVISNFGGVYFKTEELAEQAIKIMGEESLNDLFEC